MKKKIWIDMINPSHPLFFKPVVNTLIQDNDIKITLRERGETVKLAEQFSLRGKVFGKDFENPFKKTISIITRTMNLCLNGPVFDFALSFENPMSVAVSKIRSKKSILMLDNDLKYKIKGNLIQSMESRLKSMATHVIIPEVCRETFGSHIKEDKVLTYNGYKEDVYISDYIPDPDFLSKIPIKNYYVIRPEAMASFYVESKKSLVPGLITGFLKSGENVVLLPRDNSDKRLIKGNNVYVPKEPLNGLDLIYYSKGVLTGSGTMAREAAVMGKKSATFFPNKSLLSVDQDLIEKGMMFHSRQVEELLEYITRNQEKKNIRDSNRVKKEVINTLIGLINDNIE